MILNARREREWNWPLKAKSRCQIIIVGAKWERERERENLESSRKHRGWKRMMIYHWQCLAMTRAHNARKMRRKTMRKKERERDFEINERTQLHTITTEIKRETLDAENKSRGSWLKSSHYSSLSLARYCCNTKEGMGVLPFFFSSQLNLARP